MEPTERVRLPRARATWHWCNGSTSVSVESPVVPPNSSSGDEELGRPAANAGGTPSVAGSIPVVAPQGVA